MKRFFLTAVALGLGLFVLAEDAYAHGGAFRGPNGGVPPGMREPSDPEPPPPPPSDPGDPGGPTTPGEPDPSGPTTPTTPDTPSNKDNSPPPSLGPQTGPKKRPTSGTLSFDSWRFWWGYNNDAILNLKEEIYKSTPTSSSGMRFAGARDRENKQNPQRLTKEKVTREIIPALEERLQDPHDNEDVHGGALVALGKIGNSTHIPVFKAAMHNKLRNDKGQKVKLGRQATESAVLALGLLQNLDEQGRKAVREICLEAIADTNMGTRERAWSAVSLGLQRDTAALDELWTLLGTKYKNDNIPAGILVGIGLMADDGRELTPMMQEYRQKLADAFLSRNLAGRKGVSERVQAFIGYALAKMGDPQSLDVMYRVLKRRRFGNIAKRSAAMGTGVLASRLTDPAEKEKAVRALKAFIGKTGDPTSINFATISLSKIGTPEAIRLLLKYADKGSYGQRPFAALGLGTHVWYRTKAGTMNEDERKDIVAKLAKLEGKLNDPDSKAAFMLARGLVKDKTAIPELVSIVISQGKDPVLRGFCCVTLGLIGDARQDVKDALKLALRERRSEDLRRDAATGLGLLHDAEVVSVLLEELDKAKSMTVQGQIITALGMIGDHKAVRPLIEILKTKSKPTVTRAMSSVGLGLIGDLRPLPELSRVAKDYNYRASVRDLDELLYIL